MKKFNFLKKLLSKPFQFHEKRNYFSEIFLILLSVFLAYILWLITMFSSMTTKSISIRILVTNAPKCASYTIISPASQYLNIDVTCPHNLVNSFNSSNFLFNIDLSSIKKEISSFEINKEFPVTPSMIKKVNIPSLVTITDVYPKSVKIKVKFFNKKVPIKLNLQGTPAPYYHIQLDECSTKPAEVTIISSTDILEKTLFIRTFPINVKGRKKSFVQNVALDIPQNIYLFDKIDSVEAFICIKENIIEKTIKNVPIKVEMFYPNIKTTVVPDKVDIVIKGPKSLVEKVSAEDINIPIIVPNEEGTIEKEINATLSEKLLPEILTKVKIEKIIPSTVSLINVIKTPSTQPNIQSSPPQEQEK